MDEELVLIEITEETKDEAVTDQYSVNVETFDTDTGVAEFDGELDNDTSMEEITLDVLEDKTVEEIEIEVNDLMGWSGDGSTHEGLPDRNTPNQHIISSITGLEEILDEIEALKTVYSDGHNVANYYKWEGGKAYDTYGYFVSLTSDPSEIKICEGSDIFGVSVDTAGFIGGQDATVSRDNHYGLVVTSGLVDVRCELDINIGDCVVSNVHGYAKKADSNYGYRVLARVNKDGVEYAVIALGAQADKTNELGIELAEIQEQVDANYTNIISAVNVANQAYNKAADVETSNQTMYGVVNEAVGKVDRIATDVENLTTQVSNSALAAAQAKAIAESAATSAESMKNDAVEKANEALAESSELRRELEVKIAEIDTELDNTALELEATKESIESTKNELQSNIDDVSAELDNTKTDVDNMREEITADIEAVDKNLDETKEMLNTTKEELSNSINTNKENIESISQEIEPLATWSNDTQSGTAGFVARANGDSATLASIVTWQGETNESIAGFKQEVADTYATIESVTSLKSETTEAIAGVKQEATETYATIESVTALQTETTEAIAGVKQEASETYATIESVASLETNTSNAIAGVKQEVSETYATIESVASLETETSKSIADFKQEVQDGYATQQMVSAVNDSLSSFKQEVEDDYATQEMVSAVDDALTSYKQEVEDTYATQEMVTSVGDNLTSYKQEVSETYATQQMVSTVDEALTSYKQEASDNYATQQMVTEVEDNLANFQQEVEDGYATQEMVTTVDNALTTYKQEVEKNYATQQMLTTVENNLASFQQEVKNDYATQQMVTTVGNNLASFEQEVGETYATQEMVTTLETNTSKALADYKQEVQDGYATQAMVTKLETDTSKALTDYKQEVGNIYATNTSLAGLRTETTNAIAASEEKATTTYASKSDLTSFESDTNIAMARIEQKADANGAYIQSTVSNMDKYSVGPHSQAYGFTLEQATSVLEEGMIYVPTESVTEKYKYVENETTKTYERSFTPQYLYKWGKVSEQYRWITVDKNYTETSETNASSKAVYFTTTEPTVGGNFGYWYTNGDTITGTTGTYEPYTLYKWESYVDENEATQYHWVAVATLAGNSQNRAVSQIRQDANSIELRVTNTEGSAASSKQWIDDNSANIQDVVSWKSENGESLVTFMQTADENYASASQVAKIVDEDGNVIESSIVTAVNNNASSIYLSADNITFEGFTSFKAKVEDVEDKSIYDTKVEYALSSSFTEFTAVTGNDGKWSTTAPAWRADAYMWQKTTITKGDASVASTQTCIHGAKGQDGTIDPNAKQVNTHTRTQPLTWWQEHADSACTDRNWTINAGQGYTNTHLAKGDLAYIVGVATGNDNTNMTVIICGTVEEVVEPSGSTAGKVTMIPSHLIVGGQKGDQGGKGNDAPKVVSEEKQFHTSTSNTTAPDSNSSGWETVPMNYEKGKYLWTRSVYTMDDNSVIKGDAYLDKNFTTISNWCKDNNEAYIDGANIYAGSVTASQIDTTTLIVGENIQMGENATISWDKVDNKPSVATTTDVSNAKNEAINDAKSGAISEIESKGYQTEGQVTTITRNEISTATIRANQINTNGLQAEYIQSSNYLGDSSDSLVFTPRQDDTYKVGLKQGSISETIIIPQSYNGKQVIEIDKDSFAYGAGTVKMLAIPASVTEIPFGFLEGYSVLEELHIPLHTGMPSGGGSAWFVQWFGMEDDEASNKIPMTLSKVYLLGRDGEDLIPSSYFAAENPGPPFELYLTPSINNLGRRAFGAYKGGQVYHYGQIEATSNSGVDFVVLEEPYVFPCDDNVISGFRISSKDENMINSPHFKVTQDGEVTADSGDIAGWEITEDGIHKKDSNGNSLVGMHSGDTNRASLVQIEAPIKSTATMNKAFLPTVGQPDVVNVGNNNKATRVIAFSSIKPDHLSQNYCYASVNEDGSIVIKYYFVISVNTGDVTELSNLISYTIEYEYLTGETNLVQAPDSPVRFYAGNKSELANKGFVVLEDGSLYASAVDIRGHIEAESGSFSGSIEAKGGSIGDLNIVANGISSDDGKLAFNSDGSIVTQTFEASHIKTAQISGRTTGSPSLTFETSSNKLEDVTAKMSYNIEREGEQNLTDITDAGEVSLTITTNKILTASKSFNAHVKYYNSFWDDTETVVISIIVPSGYDTATTTVPHMRWINAAPKARFTFDSALINQTSFEQISGTSTSDIVASAHFIPSKDGLTLGSTAQPWEKIFSQELLTKTTSWGSDRRLKNNIKNIDNDFSEQLIKKLLPKSYEFKSTQGITRYGFIAQEAEEALASLGVDINSTGVIRKTSLDKSDKDNGYYSLNYIDLIAPMVSVIQRLLERVEELEEKLNNTK